jgi:two-component system, OmpR family, KDP operon response regulator KdpE
MTSCPATILLVEDDPVARKLLRATLSCGYRLLAAVNGRAAMSALCQYRPELVLLNLGLPDLDGQELIRRIRLLGSVPIVVLSSRRDEFSKVAALDAGADDYVTKPFGAEELMARIRAALRHRLQQQGTEGRFISSDLDIDLVRRRVRREGVDVKLSPKEYDILKQLVIHAGRVVTHTHLFHEVWHDELSSIEVLRVQVCCIRRKIEANPTKPRHVLTQLSIGYRLV